MNLCDDLEKDEVQVMLYHLNFEGFKNNETWFEDFLWDVKLTSTLLWNKEREEIITMKLLEWKNVRDIMATRLPCNIHLKKILVCPYY